jgi:hypothetical protein
MAWQLMNLQQRFGGGIPICNVAVLARCGSSMDGR